MGLFGESDKTAYKLGQLEAKVEALERENSSLLQEKQQLHEKIEHLQESIIALKSPQSYRMLQDDKLIRDWEKEMGPDLNLDPLSTEEAKVLNRYSREMEGTILRSADDLFDMLHRSQGVPVHGPVDENNPEES